MRSAYVGLVAATIAAWLFFLLHMGALAISLSRMNGTTWSPMPALLIGGAGLLASAFVGFSTQVSWSRPARVVLELLLLGVALLFLMVVFASRAG